MVEIDKMCEQYYAEHGEMPANAFLDSLADQILYEELADTHPDKVTREEFPILSESQLLLRRTGKGRSFKEVELDVDEIDSKFFHNAELDLYITAKIKRDSVSTVVMPVEISYLNHCLLKVRKPQKGRGDGAAVWARLVKDRDKYTCQNPLCDSRVGIMHAHHIKTTQITQS